MSNTPNIVTEISDEALEPVPAQEAIGSCYVPACVVVVCRISDEALEPAPTQIAAVCGAPVCIGPCFVSDEALDPAPAQQAAVCVNCVVCIATLTGISDETLDPAPAQQALASIGPSAPCAGPCAGGGCFISDEALDPGPVQASAFPCGCIGWACHGGPISDERDAR